MNNSEGGPGSVCRNGGISKPLLMVFGVGFSMAWLKQELKAVSPKQGDAEGVCKSGV